MAALLQSLALLEHLIGLASNFLQEALQAVQAARAAATQLARPPGFVEEPDVEAAAGDVVLPPEQPVRVEQVSPARIERAQMAGRSALRKLSGVQRTVTPTPPLEGLQNRFWVILRASPDALPQQAVCSSWRSARGLVQIGTELSPEAVFHAFPSLAEVRAYCDGAEVPLPARVP